MQTGLHAIRLGNSKVLSHFAHDIHRYRVLFALWLECSATTFVWNFVSDVSGCWCLETLLHVAFRCEPAVHPLLHRWRSNEADEKCLAENWTPCCKKNISFFDFSNFSTANQPLVAEGVAARADPKNRPLWVLKCARLRWGMQGNLLVRFVYKSLALVQAPCNAISCVKVSYLHLLCIAGGLCVCIVC